MRYPSTTMMASIIFASLTSDLTTAVISAIVHEVRSAMCRCFKGLWPKSWATARTEENPNVCMSVQYVCMYVCMYVCISSVNLVSSFRFLAVLLAGLYKPMCINVLVNKNNARNWMYVCMHVSVFLTMYMCIYVCIYMYIYVCVCICTFWSMLLFFFLSTASLSSVELFHAPGRPHGK